MERKGCLVLKYDSRPGRALGMPLFDISALISVFDMKWTFKPEPELFSTINSAVATCQ